jgi:N-acetyl-gamma-glutamyl-phosphate reductase
MDRQPVRVAVVGATGYAGVEAVRLLAAHPQARCTYLASHSQEGRLLGEIYPHLLALGPLPLQPVDVDAIASAADVALLALPARESLDLAPRLLERGLRVIDFGADFRLRDAATYARTYGGPHTAPEWLGKAVYGLTEWHRDEVRAARLVANPGCYPTAALLALWPALQAGLVAPAGIVVDAKSGVTGAGRQPTQHTHFPEVDGGMGAYAVAGAHRHTPEIAQELARAAGQSVRLTFTPHLLPTSRGLLASCYAPLRAPTGGAEVLALYREAYAGAPFVQVLERGLPQTKAVSGSNLAQLAVAVDADAACLVALCAIDNLGKGAAGSAIQNLNVMCGLEETAGLPRVGLYP